MTMLAHTHTPGGGTVLAGPLFSPDEQFYENACKGTPKTLDIADDALIHALEGKRIKSIRLRTFDAPRAPDGSILYLEVEVDT